MQVDRITTDSQDLAMVLLELLEPLGEPDQFGRADERKITGIEEKQQPAATIVFERRVVPRGVWKPGAG